MKTQNKTGHTPGPWTVDTWDYSHANPPRKELNVQTADYLIARVAWDEEKENPSEYPCEGGTTREEAISYVRKAIAKAEGSTDA